MQQSLSWEEISDVRERLRGLEERAAGLAAELAALRNAVAGLHDLLAAAEGASPQAAVRQQLDADEEEELPPALSEEEAEALRREIQEMLGQAHALTEAQPDGQVVSAAAQAAMDDEDARREEVRRAVEAARSELGLTPREDFSRLRELMAGRFGATPTGETATPVEASRPPEPTAAERWTASRAEPVPTSIVIEDEYGRIELVHVFDTLNRIGCGDDAALLNYSPHSVTIGLPSQASLPDASLLLEAARAAFGRNCEATSDGVRININLTDLRPAAKRW